MLLVILCWIEMSRIEGTLPGVPLV
jgi:hypothetical protein